MAIQVTCQCGETYVLKDEYAGQVVSCPQCGESLQAGEAPPRLGDPAFDRDKFLLRQKHLAISEKYYVWDDGGAKILYMERPAHLARNLLAAFAGIAAGVVVLSAFLAIGDAAGPGTVQTASFVLAVIGGIAAIVVVGVGLSKKRHLTIYRDDTKREKLLEIYQDRKFQPINATYTVRDAGGGELARLRKNHLYNFFRKRWYCRLPDGTLLCLAKEDSIILSLLRRVMGSFFGLLRTNFVIFKGATDEVVGEFNRKFTLLDRYVLDMTRDRARDIDRRLALALGVMLDTGERR